MTGMTRAATHKAPRVWIITVALVGLTVLQFLLLRFAWELKNRAFENNVTTALTVTAANLENEEIFGGAVKQIHLAMGDSVAFAGAGRHIWAEATDRSASGYGAGWHDMGSIVCADTLVLPDVRTGSSPWSRVATETGGNAITVLVRGERTELIQRIVGDLMEVETRPIRERLAAAGLDSLLAANLAAVGVDDEPEFGVLSADTDSLVYAVGDVGRQDLVDTVFKARLFPLDPRPPCYDLALHFPGRRAYLAGQIWPFWLATIVFMTVIVSSFVRTLRANAAQRRYAEHLVDFVNNMTHEFKTPLSTVSLASEALSREDIAEHPDALRRYNRMIRDENRRMGAQVEKILQIAQLESGDFQLNRTPTVLDALVAEAAAAFALQVERRGGELTVACGVGDARVAADPVHLAAAVSNLIDNAVKYAVGPPAIRVSTRRDGDALVVEVADRGPGVAEQDRDRVFDKYFRAHTGNRHDVKGFGLGLSYVRLVVEAHGGRAALTPRPGGGVAATLRLPAASASPAGEGTAP
jgi:two-component system phosphate regulon sensor histidine kinase PhoR